MKKPNQNNETNQNPESVEQTNWAVVGTIIAVMVGVIIWALF